MANLRVIAEGKGVDALFDRLDELQIQEAALQTEIMQMIYNNQITEASNVMRNSYERVFDEITENVMLLFDAADKDALNFITEAQEGKRNAILVGILSLIHIFQGSQKMGSYPYIIPNGAEVILCFS